MASEVKYIITAEDKTRGATSSASRGAGNMIKSFHDIKAAADVATQAVRMIAQAVGGLTNVYRVQAGEDAKMTAIIKATGNQLGTTTEELKAYASEMQDLTGIGDQVVQGAQSMLLTFREIGEDVFPRATEAILDMSKIFGSVQSSAVQVGKALNDPIAGITALQRVGVTFSDQQKEMISNMMELGDVAGAQGVILSELENQFGGVARAMHEQPIGRLDDLVNLLGDLGEVIGGEIITNFAPLISRLSDFVRALLQGNPLVNAFGDAMAFLSDSFDFVIDAGAGLLEIISPIWGAIQNLASSITESEPLMVLFGRAVHFAGSSLKFFAEIAAGAIQATADIIDIMSGIDIEAKKQAISLDRTGTSVKKLIESYTEISSKSFKTEEEQKKLNHVIDELSEIVPGAVSAVDSYGNALDINKEKVTDFLAENTRLQIQLAQDMVKATAKSKEGYRSSFQESIKLSEGNQELSESYYRVKAAVENGTASLGDLLKAAEDMGASNELIGALKANRDNVDGLKRSSDKLRDSYASLNELKRELRRMFKDTTEEVEKQDKAVKATAKTIDTGYSSAWENVLKLLDRFGDPLENQKRELENILSTLNSYSGVMREGTEEYEIWKKVLDLVGDQLDDVIFKISDIHRADVILRVIGGDSAVDAWEMVKEINKSALSDTERQRIAIMENLSELERFKELLKESTEGLDPTQIEIKEGLIAEVDAALSQLSEDLAGLSGSVTDTTDSVASSAIQAQGGGGVSDDVIAATGLNEASMSIEGFALAAIMAVAEIESVGKTLDMFGTVIDATIGIVGDLINETFAPIAGILTIWGTILGELMVPILNILAPILKLVAEGFLILYNNALVPVINFLVLIIGKIAEMVGNVINFVVDIINALGGSAERFDVQDAEFGNLETINFSQLSETGGVETGADGASGGAGAQYTGGRTVNVTINIEQPIIIDDTDLSRLAETLTTYIRLGEEVGL